MQFLDWLEKNRSLSVAEVCNSTRETCHWNTTAELNATNPELFYLSWQFQYEWGAIWCESPHATPTSLQHCIPRLAIHLLLVRMLVLMLILCSPQTRTSRRSWPS